MNMKLRKYIFVSLLLAGAIVLSYFESFIQLPIALPGFKLGLANIVVLIMIYEFDFKDSFGLVLGRIFIVSLLKGTFLGVTFVISLSGGLLSFMVMYLLHKTKMFSIVGLSVAGAISHSVGQILAIIFIVGTIQIVIIYLPLLMLLSVFTGFFNALVAKRFLTTNLLNKELSQED